MYVNGNTATANQCAECLGKRCRTTRKFRVCSNLAKSWRRKEASTNGMSRLLFATPLLLASRLTQFLQKFSRRPSCQFSEQRQMPLPFSWSITPAHHSARSEYHNRRRSLVSGLACLLRIFERFILTSEFKAFTKN